MSTSADAAEVATPATCGPTDTVASTRPLGPPRGVVALVLATARLGDGSPAAAVRVGGLTVLERSLFAAREAGARHAIVVADEESLVRLRAAVSRPDLRVPVDFVPTASPQLAERLQAAEEVVLFVANVVSSHHLPKRLKAVPATPASVLVGVPPVAATDPSLTLQDGWPWIGAARVSPDLALAVLGAVRRDPVRGLADTLREAVAAGQATQVVASEVTWQPIRDSRDVPAARRVLFRSLGKSADGWVSRTLNRPVSTLVSRWLVETPITPNTISVLDFLLRVGACALIACGGRYLAPLLGFVLLQLASILDGCDGELARVRYQTSLFGARLDTMLDHVTTLLLAASLATNLWRHGGCIIYPIMAGVTIVGGIIAMTALFSYLLATGSGGAYDVPGPPPLSSWKNPVMKVLAFIGNLTRLDSMYFVFVLLALLGLFPLIMLTIMGGGIGLPIFYVRRRLQLAAEARARRQEPG